jgi:hypothetical protein
MRPTPLRHPGVRITVLRNWHIALRPAPFTIAADLLSSPRMFLRKGEHLRAGKLCFFFAILFDVRP